MVLTITKEDPTSGNCSEAVSLGLTDSTAYVCEVQQLIDNLTQTSLHDFLTVYPLDEIQRFLQSRVELEDVDIFSVGFMHFAFIFPWVRAQPQASEKRTYGEIVWNDSYAQEYKAIISELRWNQSKSEFLKTFDEALVQCGFALHEAERQVQEMFDITNQVRHADNDEAEEQNLQKIRLQFYKTYLPVYFYMREKWYSHADLAVYVD